MIQKKPNRLIGVITGLSVCGQSGFVVCGCRGRTVFVQFRATTSEKWCEYAVKIIQHQTIRYDMVRYTELQE